VIAILFCADPLAPGRVDDHFAEQAELSGRWAGRSR